MLNVVPAAQPARTGCEAINTRSICLPRLPQPRVRVALPPLELKASRGPLGFRHANRRLQLCRYESGTGPGPRLRDLIEEIELADQVGLDVFGVGEHHRPDYAASAPAVVLGAAAVRTKNIRLTSAVTVLSSDDPVRVFQEFSTIDLLSNGRAEIMAGRGSFIESFPLFGFDLGDYDALFPRTSICCWRFARTSG